MTVLEWFFYVSCAAPALTHAQLDAIQQASQCRNSQHGLTGMLLYSGRHFAQVLEGPAQPLGAVMTSILADARHRQVRILARAPLAQRRFGTWSMGYVHGMGKADLIEQVHQGPQVSMARAGRLAQLMFDAAGVGPVGPP